MFLSNNISAESKFSQISVQWSEALTAGPYLATIGDGVASFASVYRLYPDTYRTFLFGTYSADDNEGNHKPLGVFLPKFWDPMIP